MSTDVRQREFVVAACLIGIVGVAGCTSLERPAPSGTVTSAPTLAMPTSVAPTTGPAMPAPATSPVTSAPGTSGRPVTTPTAQEVLDNRLREAAWSDDVSAAERLIGQGADSSAQDGTGQSAFLIAASEGHLGLLNLILDHGTDIEATDSWNGTGLIRAAERGHSLLVGRLLTAGSDPDHVNRLGYQAIHEAVWLGKDSITYVDTVLVLAAGGAELTRPSGTEKLTPVQMAAARGYPHLEEVLTSVLDPTELTEPNASLLRAAEDGDATQVARALRAGADIETRDGSGRSALLLAATFDRVAVARVLVAMGASPDALDDRHDTPWLVTGVTGSVEMLEALLPAGPDLTIRNRYGGISVIPASERGHVDYVRRVVSTGIDVNHVNDLGWTALLEAVVLGNGDSRYQEIVRILLAAGADPDIADDDGITPLHHARSRGFGVIADLLEQ